MEVLSYVVAILGAYLLGSLPTGYLVARAKGIDIRSIGSGNIGATNVLRTLGAPTGILVLVVDGLKGFAACTWLCDLFLDLFHLPLDGSDLHRILAGIAAVLGHNFTCWLRFKGGKGIATSAGVYFALAPVAAGIALGTWGLTVLLTRFVSAASIAAAVVLPLMVWLLPNNLTLRIVTSVLGLLAIWKHKGNIERLLNGTEKRIGVRPLAQEAAK